MNFSYCHYPQSGSKLPQSPFSNPRKGIANSVSTPQSYSLNWQSSSFQCPPVPSPSFDSLLSRFPSRSSARPGHFRLKAVLLNPIRTRTRFSLEILGSLLSSSVSLCGFIVNRERYFLIAGEVFYGKMRPFGLVDVRIAQVVQDVCFAPCFNCHCFWS
jgi:hypothetical protein